MRGRVRAAQGWDGAFDLSAADGCPFWMPNPFLELKREVNVTGIQVDGLVRCARATIPVARCGHPLFWFGQCLWWRGIGALNLFDDERDQLDKLGLCIVVTVAATSFLRSPDR